MKRRDYRERATILVVEDNLQLLRVIRLKLEQDGFSVLSAESGDDAIILLGSVNPPDILLTDAVMPGNVQGPELARFVKAQYPSLPVVLMSAYLGAEDLPELEIGQIEAFLTKPLQLATLSERLWCLLKTRLAEFEGDREAKIDVSPCLVAGT